MAAGKHCEACGGPDHNLHGHLHALVIGVTLAQAGAGAGLHPLYQHALVNCVRHSQPRADSDDHHVLVNLLPQHEQAYRALNGPLPAVVELCGCIEEQHLYGWEG